jgi:hypothetical protein
MPSPQEIDTPYGTSKNQFSSEEQDVLELMAADKMARVFYENQWREYNYAYQMILYEYAYQRQFNPSLPLEQQVRNMFPEKKLADYKLPLEFAVITRQIADELNSLPRPKWTSMTDDPSARDGKSKIFQKLYDFTFDQCDGDWEQFKGLLSKAINGTSIEHVFHEYAEYPDYEASGVDEDGQVTYKNVNRVIDRVRFKNMDLRHVLIDCNATDINDAEHDFILSNINYPTFKKMFGNEKIFDIENVKPVMPTEAFVTLGEARKGVGLPVVQVALFHDVPNNRMMWLANGKRINRKDMHIPIPSVNGKPMLPLAVHYEAKADNEFYGISKCTIIKPFREVKNKLRNAFFDIAKKMAFNTLVVDPMSDFDETTYEFGQPFIRAIPDEIKPIPASGNLQPIVDLDKQTDQDIITFTGINILNTAGGSSSESATKTAVRQESQVKLVELGLKMNSYHGYKRRAILMKQLIRLHYSSGRIRKIVNGVPEPIVITTPGIQMFRGGLLRKNKIDEQKIDGIGRFEIKQTDMKDDVELVVEGGNVSATKELVKARQLDAANFIKSIPPDPQGQANYDVKALIQWAVNWGELPKEIIKGGAESISDKTPEDIIQGMDLLEKPPTIQDALNQQKNAQQGGQAAGQAPQAPTAAGGRPVMAGQGAVSQPVTPSV